MLFRSWQILVSHFYADPQRPKLNKPLLYDEWEIGKYDPLLDKYEDYAAQYCAENYKNLFTFYKSDDFDVIKLIESVNYVAADTDLIIIDHVHYFDWDDRTNDNSALKHIAKTARRLVQYHEKPIVLVSHLRKKDKAQADLAASLDEYMGSSDLTKIATKVLSIGSGGPAPEGGFFTFFRTPKNRHNGSSTRYLAQVVFDDRKGGYAKEYKLGWANAGKFGEIAQHEYPKWVGRNRNP